MIQVEEMRIRVSGMGEEEVRLMSEDVANRLAAKLPDNIDNRQIDELNIRLSFSPGMGREAMADNIATQILQQLELI